MKRHLSINITRFLEKGKNESLSGLLSKPDGSPASDQEVREYLSDCLLKGWTLFPVGDCNNFDPQKGCQGHPDKEIKEQSKKEILISAKDKNHKLTRKE